MQVCRALEDDTEELCGALLHALTVRPQAVKRWMWWAWSWGFGGWGYSVGLKKMLQVALVVL